MSKIVKNVVWLEPNAKDPTAKPFSHKVGVVVNNKAGGLSLILKMIPVGITGNLVFNLYDPTTKLENTEKKPAETLASLGLGDE